MIEGISPINPTNSNNITNHQILSQEKTLNRINDDNEDQNPLVVNPEFESFAGEPMKVDRPKKRTSKQKRFECFDCKDASFADFKDLSFHMRIHLDHIENIDMKTKLIFENVVIQDSIKYHVCEVCGNSYSTNVKLYQHRCKYHPV